MKTFIECERCDKVVPAQVFHTNAGTEVTVGFYRLYEQDGSETIWKKMGLGIPGEVIICTSCMRSDKKFLELYPWVKNLKDKIGAWW